ncbi:MAG: DoxX family protein [Flavobacteriales bacterium]
MKKINTFYWITTALFAAFMIFTAIPNIAMNEESIQFMNGLLGYPKYLIPFIGVAKIAGSISILIPGFRRIKEWAYAGLFFDLTGALYSVIAIVGFEPTGIVFMSFAIALLFTSYFLWHKKIEGAKA